MLQEIEWGDMAFSLRNIFCGFFVGSVVVVLLFSHTTAAAATPNLRITEVLYDYKVLDDDSDDGREWIEVINVGPGSVTLTEIQLVDEDVEEDEVNVSGGSTHHGIKEFRGGAVLTPGSVAIISEKPDTFLQRYSTYTGLLFASSFSLKNTGLSLNLLFGKRGERSITTTTTYSSDDGGKGDGNSLHIAQDGTITASTPTPGEVSGFTIDYSEVEGGETGTTGTSTSSVTTLSPTELAEEKRIFKKTIDDFRVTISPYPILTALTTKFVLEEIFSNDSEKYSEGLWNFGDGHVAEGSIVYYSYSYPGTYIVSVQVPDFTEPIRVSVTIVDPKIQITVGDDTLVRLKNDHSFIFDISGWQIVKDDTVFVFPDQTFISANATIPTRFSVIPGDTIQLTTERNAVVSTLVVPTVRAIEQAPLPIKSTPNKIPEKSQEVSKEKTVEESKPKPSTTEKTFTTPFTKKIQPDRSSSKQMAILWAGIFIGLLLILMTPLLFAKTRRQTKKVVRKRAK